MVKKAFPFSFIFIISFSLLAQNNFNVKDEEYLIISLFKSLFKAQDSLEIFEINDKIIQRLKSDCENKTFHNYEFRELSKTVPVLHSNKNKILIFSWYLQYNKIFYFFTIISNSENNIKTFILKNNSKYEIESPEYRVLNKKNWIGALYYNIIPVIYKRKKYYVLLSFRPVSNLLNQKIIETMYFDKKGNPNFGASVFKINKKTKRRIIFNYSSDLTMSLRYHPKEKMIVFDHLSPPSEEIAGQYEFYGPDLSFDAFILKKGKWYFKKDVDVRNNNKKFNKFYTDPR